MTAAPALLEARDVRFAYGDRPVLDGVSIALAPGRVVGLAGPNGAGKSTLVYLLCGLFAPEAGDVRLDGRPLARVAPRDRARSIALAPSDFAAPFAYGVREVVETGRTAHVGPFGPLGAADRAAVDSAIERCDLAALADRSVFRLSSGERQRVAIARALAQAPRVLLVDEPTVHMDLRHQADVHRLLRSLADDSLLAVLVVSHDLNALGRWCDEAVLLAAGRVERAGPPRDVLDAGLLSKVYATPVEVHPHPRTGTPTVWPA